MPSSVINSEYGFRNNCIFVNMIDRYAYHQGKEKSEKNFSGN